MLINHGSVCWLSFPVSTKSVHSSKQLPRLTLCRWTQFLWGKGKAQKLLKWLRKQHGVEIGWCCKTAISQHLGWTHKHHVPPLAHQLPIWPVPCCHSSKWCENDKWVTKRLEEQHASGNENCHSKKNLPARVPDKPIILSSIRPSIISISQSEYYMRMCVCVCLLELPILSNIRSQVLCIHWRKRECVAQDGVWSSLFPCSCARAHQVWAIGMEHTIPVQWSRFEDQSPAAPVLS